jgi:hypothetical protein
VVRWSEVAEANGRAVHPQMQWHLISGVDTGQGRTRQDYGIWHRKSVLCLASTWSPWWTCSPGTPRHPIVSGLGYGMGSEVSKSAPAEQRSRNGDSRSQNLALFDDYPWHPPSSFQNAPTTCCPDR